MKFYKDTYVILNYSMIKIIIEFQPFDLTKLTSVNSVVRFNHILLDRKSNVNLFKNSLNKTRCFWNC